MMHKSNFKDKIKDLIEALLEGEDKEFRPIMIK
jgi:hypothetical protein